jgi:type VI secretion system protein ImpL
MLVGAESGSLKQAYWMAGVIAGGLVFLIIMGVYNLTNHSAIQDFEIRRQLAAGDDYRLWWRKK